MAKAGVAAPFYGQSLFILRSVFVSCSYRIFVIVLCNTANRVGYLGLINHVNLRVLRVLVELVIKDVTDRVGYNSYDAFRKVVILRK